MVEAGSEHPDKTVTLERWLWVTDSKDVTYLSIISWQSTGRRFDRNDLQRASKHVEHIHDVANG